MQHFSEKDKNAVYLGERSTYLMNCMPPKGICEFHKRRLKRNCLDYKL